jgi:RHS repeat-associated protein
MTNATNSANSANSFTSIVYDNNGNVETRNEGSNPVSFTYSGSNSPTVYTNNGSVDNLTYDRDGNMTYNPNTYTGITYDPFTELMQELSYGKPGYGAEYEYIGNKERVLKSTLTSGVVTGMTLYLRGTSNYPLEQQSGSATRYYIYGPTGLVAVIDGGAMYFMLKDHLGSTQAVLNNSNNPVSWYSYTPYGRIWQSSVSEDVAYKFTGQELDNESMYGLYNFRAREYDPVMGIFYASDPADQTFSSYGYVNGNPVMYTDPTGQLFGWDDLFVSAISFAVGYFTHAIETNQWGRQSLESGAEDAVIADLAYNTGGAAAGLVASKGTTAYSIISSTVGSATGGFSGNVVGQLNQNGWSLGQVNWGQAGESALAGFGGGLAGGLTDAYITPEIPMFPGYHTVDQMIRSTAYEIGANAITGQNPFSNLDFGINPSIAFPLAGDVVYASSYLWANDLKSPTLNAFHIKLPNSINASNVSISALEPNIGLTENGDLSLGTAFFSGAAQFTNYHLFGSIYFTGSLAAQNFALPFGMRNGGMGLTQFPMDNNYFWSFLYFWR